MSKSTKVPVTKERITAVCKRVNNGEYPTQAVRAEGLGGAYLSSLKKSGILYKDPLTGRWQGIMRIHDERYEKFISIRKGYSHTANKNYRSKISVTTKVIRAKKTKRPTEKIGMFRRIWNSIFG